MSVDDTVLTKKEIRWITERRVTRLTDYKEVQIYPMGAERYLSSALVENKKNRYNLKNDIIGKDILLIPGHGNSSFLFAQAGAKSVTVYDKDPVTIAWIKAFKKYYYYRGRRTENYSSYPSIGELLSALTQWYPPLINLPYGKYRNFLLWCIQPNLLRRIYIHYTLSLVQQALQSKIKNDFELNKNIKFYTGTIDSVSMNKGIKQFDTAFIPYLLGVQNGIEQETEITLFMKKMIRFIPDGQIIISPSRNKKEFFLIGKRYFITTKYKNIQSIPEIHQHFKLEDKHWFCTQGLAVFSTKN